MLHVCVCFESNFFQKTWNESFGRVKVKIAPDTQEPAAPLSHSNGQAVGKIFTVNK